MPQDTALDGLIRRLGRLPGLGPRSARRVALHLLRGDSALDQLIDALNLVRSRIRTCSTCGNLDETDPCGLCTDPSRDASRLCVVQDVAGLWALERAHAFRGRYHVLGGLLSALEGVGPEDLGFDRLVSRVTRETVSEVILALPATVEGQSTAHVLADLLRDAGVTAITGLAQGVPVGGELDVLDDGTLTAALHARRPLET